MRSYSHLSEDERDQIGVLRAAGRSMGAIARALGRAKATISRELQRNALPLGVARQSGWEGGDSQDGHFGGRGGGDDCRGATITQALFGMRADCRGATIRTIP